MAGCKARCSQGSDHDGRAPEPSMPSLRGEKRRSNPVVFQRPNALGCFPRNKSGVAVTVSGNLRVLPPHHLPSTLQRGRWGFAEGLTVYTGEPAEV